MHDPAATVRTNPLEDVRSAIGAKYALAGADAGLKGLGRDVAVAALTVWLEQEHVEFPINGSDDLVSSEWLVQKTAK